jgi:hypothetical protein
MTLSPELEATLRTYALGRLPEDARVALEERLVVEPEVLEALGVVEEELTEEYLEGSLSAQDRRDCERSFLASAERQRLLGFVGALKSRAARRRPAPAGDRSETWSWQPALGLAASLLLAVSLTANVWQGVKLASQEPPSPQPRGTATPVAAATQQPPAIATLAASAAPSAPATPSARDAGTHTGVSTFRLAAGALRGAGPMPRVAVPAEAAGVRLLLTLPQVDYNSYRATLRDADGEELWTAAKLRAETRPEGKAVVLLLPKQLLPRGDYLLELGGVRDKGDPEALASYAFRVSID